MLGYSRIKSILEMTRSLNNLLFIKVKTVAIKPSFGALDESYKLHWKTKYQEKLQSKPHQTIEDLYLNKAALYAEFSRIVCVSISKYCSKDAKIITSSFYHSSERNLLKALFNKISAGEAKAKTIICGHNLKGFDLPFLAKRAIINKLVLPKILNIQQVKPWEMHHVMDTMELWSFGNRYNFSSLGLLQSTLLGVHTISNIDPQKIHNLYHLEKDIKSIVQITEECANCIAQLFPIIVGYKTKDELKHALFHSSF